MPEARTPRAVMLLPKACIARSFRNLMVCTGALRSSSLTRATRRKEQTLHVLVQLALQMVSCSDCHAPLWELSPVDPLPQQLHPMKFLFGALLINLSYWSYPFPLSHENVQLVRLD